MDTFADIIDLWPAPAMRVIADDLGVPYGHVKKWRARNSIPAKFWAALIVSARAHRVPGVTADRLAALAAEREAA